MTPETWASVEAHFDALRELSPEQRAAGLAAIADETVRREVASLLEHAGQGETVTGLVAAVGAAAAQIVSPSHEHHSDSEPLHTRTLGPGEPATMVIGPYHLLQKIGEGGMGEVWLAEQRVPVRRRVALKLVKAGMNSREIIARFDAERQALALMDHPAIAKVFDAGATAQGAPYFVMEYVAGSPITTYCDHHRLSTRERLELFQRVCEGVQHAHQKAVIHRDLKPSNILVMEVDGRAAPKIIDFGVAKALTQKLTAESLFTRLGTLVGTPEYMSPEQANTAGEDIDTRTDVYSLGVIFYELLAGATPLDLKKAALEEFLRRLREDEPSKPSTKIRTQDAVTSTDVAHKRQTEPRELAKQIRGDLDSIALKALEKDRTRRYASPADFAADIGRHLRNEAVLAVPASVRYRARKFARRYRVMLATISAFALVLVAAAVISIRQGLRANREAAVAQSVNDFLQNDLLAQASSERQAGIDTHPDPDIKIRTALDRAAARVGKRFQAQPAVEASIRRTLATTYSNLGMYAQSKQQTERAIELLKRTNGPKDRATLAALNQLSYAEFALGRYPESEAVVRPLIDTQRRVLGPSDPDTLASMQILGLDLTFRAKFAEGETILKDVIQRQRSSGAETEAGLGMQASLGELYRLWGKLRDAEANDSDVVERAKRVVGLEHPLTLTLMSNLAEDYRLEGRYSESEKLSLETLEKRKRILGPEHSNTYVSMNNLASVYVLEGKYAPAEVLLRATLEHVRLTQGPDSAETLTTMHNVASAIYSQGKFAEAETVETEVLERMTRVQGREHWKTIMATDLLGGAYAMQGKLAQAESLHTESLEIARRTMGPKSAITLTTMNRLATAYRLENKTPQAEKLQLEILAGIKQVLGPEHMNTLTAMANLAFTEHLLHQDTKAMELMLAAIPIHERKYPESWQRYRCESLLGASLAGLGRHQEAEPHLLKGYQGMSERKATIPADAMLNFSSGGKWIVEMYQALGQREKAREWRVKLGI